MRLQPDVTTEPELVRYLAGEIENAEPADGASFSSHARRAFVAFHFGEYGQAARQMEQARRLSHTAHAPPHHAELYDGLTRVMMDPTLKKPALKENRRAIKAAIENLKRRAVLAPGDYAPQWRLLEAELARLEGRAHEADDHYEAAIAAAQQAGSVHAEALANELAGRCYLARGRTRIARLYLSEARALYARWGAARKVRWLEETYAPLELAPPGADARAADTPALAPALKAIAGESVYREILRRTIETAMQLGGAEKALLLMARGNDELRVEADMDSARREPELLASVPTTASDRLCRAVAHYVARTQARAIIHDAQAPQRLIPGLHNDSYVRARGTRAILGLPLRAVDGGGEMIGVLYAESRAPGAFTHPRVEALDITGLAFAARLALSHRAVADPLTGLYNRDYLETTLANELALGQRREHPVSLVMIDIDDLAHVNAHWGPEVGDEVLRHVAHVIRESCRDTDVVARAGGGGFGIILSDTHTEQALQVAERIRRTLAAQAVAVAGNRVPVTVSIGFATYSERRSESRRLINAADEALYRAKAAGRNRLMTAV